MRRFLTLALAAALLAPAAHAHPTPETRGWLDIRAHGVQFEVHLPLNRLEFALGRPLADHPDSVIARDGDALTAYLLQHVGVRSGDQGWTVQRPQLAIAGAGRSAELVATFRIEAPAGAESRRFTLLYDAITEEVRTHRAVIFLRNDWDAGVIAQPPVMLGELTSDVRRLPVDLGPPRTASAWRSLFAAGALHIADGTDHLLFLLMLILVAPLIARDRRWRDAQPARAAIRAVATVVTGFTVGHSVTLALGSTGLVTPPAAWVEVAVAVTIMIAAVHAVRPMFSRAELFMAAGFGLVHGFAFSASLDGAGLTISQHVQALLAFNLGIEAMQLALIAAVLPALLLLLRHAPTQYGRLRATLAVCTAVLACGWIIERLSLATLPALVVADTLLPFLPPLLWTAAIGTWAWTARRYPRSTTPVPSRA